MTSKTTPQSYMDRVIDKLDDIWVFRGYYSEVFIVKPIVKVCWATLLSAAPVGLGGAAYLGYQEHAENTHLKALADALVRGDLELSIEVKPGQGISLNKPKPEDKALIEFLATTGRSESVIKGTKNSSGDVSYDKEIIKLNIATPSGKQVCSIPVEGTKFKRLLQGEMPVGVLERAEINPEALGEICGSSKEQVEQMKSNIKIGAIAPSVEPAGPYSVVESEGRVAMKQRIIAPSIG